MVDLNNIGNEYLLSLSILTGSIILAKLFLLVIKAYAHRLTKKTKTDLDDEILNAITSPIYMFFIVVGIYFALISLSILERYDNIIKNAYFVVAVLLATYLLTRLVRVLVARWLKVQKSFEKTPRLVNLVVAIVLYITAILMILSHFDIQITPIMATLGIGGLAIGLALQNTLSNFFAGLHIISDKPVNVGDFIELDGNVSGYVVDIGWRSTRIKTLPNTIIIVPNSKLAESIIINDSLPEQEMAALVQVGVDYGSDLKKVEKVTIDVARHIQKTVSGAVKTFDPFIRYHTFADSNINFTVILRVEKYVDKHIVTHEFIKALKERYDKEKIEISWPVVKLHKAK